MPEKNKNINTKYLEKRSDFVSLIQVIFHLTIAFTPLFLMVIWPFHFSNILCIIFTGLSMNGIINMMHECSHYHLFKNKNLNTFLGKWILGPLFFSDFNTYRDRHWDHHRFLGTGNDTKDAYLVKISGSNVLKYFLRTLTGMEAFRKFFHQLQTNPDRQGAKPVDFSWLIRLLILHTVFFLKLYILARLIHHDPIFSLWVAVYVYAVGYLYAIMTITIFTATLRAIAEHQLTSFNIIQEGRASLRNFNCSFLSRFIFGSYGFGEHLTHHEYPAVPYYKLKNATTELAGNDVRFKPSDDYPKVLYKIIQTK